jgi:hypothetical protein
MDIRRWLEQNTTQSVISTEGILTDLKNLIADSIGSLKGDNKGHAYSLPTVSNTYNHAGLKRAFLEFYGNPAWLDKQKWNTGPIESKDIAGWLVVNGRIDAITTVKVASKSFLGTLDLWMMLLKNHHVNLQPAYQILAMEGVTDEAYVKIKAIVDKLSKPSSLLVTPKQFPVGTAVITRPDARGINTYHVAESSIAVNAMTKDQVIVCVKEIINALDHSWNHRSKSNELDHAAMWSSGLGQLHHGGKWGKKQPPQGSTVTIAQWSELSNQLDGLSLYWSSPEYRKTLVTFNHILLAIAKWIDRSIKGKVHSS